jgi:formyltetrahydrofolate-dependent phosphoribosylglycinamide formyltransferase
VSISIAVFASGGGSNFQSLLDSESEDSPGRIRLLISDRSDAGALDRARQAGIPARVVSVKGRPLDEVGEETLALLEEHGIGVILLAGYLRLIPPALIRAFPRRILNIHPALLPAFGGKGMWGHHVHEAVLASGASFSGPTIHFVDEEYDTGTILAQWPVPVRAGDTAEILAARVLAVEHILYPLAAEHLCRAVLGGREPRRLSPPGEAFQIAPTFEPQRVRNQISEALSGAP